MKFVGFLLLAVFANCEAATTIDEIREIEQESNSKIILSASNRAVGIAPRANKPVPKPGKNICQDNVLYFVDLTLPDGNNIVEKECKLVVNYNVGFCNCDLNNCQRTIPTNCPTQPALDCTADDEKKKFPSEVKCDEFRICISGKLEPGKCLPGLRFDSRADGGKGQCTSTVSCPSPLKCGSNSISQPTFAPFRLDKRFALYCYSGKSKVVTCPTKGHEWDSNGRCSYECNAPGTFADTDPESDKYYSCLGSRYPFTKREYSCGTGNAWNEDQMKCLPKTATGPGK